MATIPPYVLEGDEIDPDDWGNPVVDALADHETRLDTAESTNATQTTNIANLTGRMGTAETNITNVSAIASACGGWRQMSSIHPGNTSLAKIPFDSSVWGPYNIAYAAGGTWTVQRQGIYAVYTPSLSVGGSHAIAQVQARFAGNNWGDPRNGMIMAPASVGQTIEIWASTTSGAVFQGGYCMIWKVQSV